MKFSLPQFSRPLHGRLAPGLPCFLSLCLLAAPGVVLTAEEVWTPESHYGEAFTGPDVDAQPKKQPTPDSKNQATSPAKKKAEKKSASSPGASAQEDAAKAKPSLAERFQSQSTTWVAEFQAPASPFQLEPLTPEGERAVKNLAAWAKQVAQGDFAKGRPLPVAGNWNVAEGQFSPGYLVDLIRKGNHVAVAFEDPHSSAFNNTTLDGRKSPQLQKILDEYYRPALEFAKAHNLPIVFRGWNWGADPVNYQTKLETRKGVKFATEELAAVLLQGQPQRDTDPLGPIKAWQEWGRFWFGNELIKELQKIYPNPPLVIFLNNNEGGDLHTSADFEKTDRFRQKFGEEPRDKLFVDRAIWKGYQERYAALFEAAKASLVSPAWKSNTRFVAYNTIFGAAYFGNGRLPQPGIGFDPEIGLTKWRMYDGSMPELYDNDWQPGKRDYTPWNMQAESGAVHGYEEYIRKERPNFISGAIVWDGAVPSEVFRGRRGTSKPFYYASRGLRWGFDRYEGWMTFGLWAMRPTLFWEFRAGEPTDAVRLGTWEPLLREVDLPWNDETLREFWTSGRLVPNRAEGPWFNELPEDAPDWIKSLDRWFLLTSSANPPRAEWETLTPLRVFAQALELGSKPNRRWLVVAHAPNGAVASSKLTIPDYMEIELPSLSRTCSFFVVEEKSGKVATLRAGGPAELELRVTEPGTLVGNSHWFAPGSTVSLETLVTQAPGLQADDFLSSFGDGKTQTEKTAGKVSHRFEREGAYLVTVQARSGGKPVLTEQLMVNIGETPKEEVVYDLPLDEASAWEGPWAASGERELVTYRHLPNRGLLASPVVAGGRFVEDAERGRVYEMVGNEDGIFLQRSLQTVLRGGKPTPTGPDPETLARNRTVSFWFKAEDVQTRQVLFAEGMHLAGMNVYLDGGNLYAGSFATPDGTVFGQDPVSGYNWPGEWIHTGPIEAGKWYHVSWILENAGPSVEPDKQALYFNGKCVGRAAGAGLPTYYAVPRIGRTNMDNDTMNGKKNALTRFHDQAQREGLKGDELNALNQIPVFRGRIDDFRYVNAVEIPEEK